MPRIFDNIEADLLPALRQTLAVSIRSDFCVGYFNLRGWKAIDAHIEAWPGGDGQQCRLLVGMQRLEEAELRDALQRVRHGELLDLATARRMREQAAKAFKDQLTWGCPTRDDETALRRLSAQLHAKKLAVKLFLSHPLHAKLYLCFRADPNNPITGFLGSSNLTFSGLSAQGELNVDVLEHDATNKLTTWFNNRWDDRWCLDITDELADIIDQSWARPDLLPPYHVYLKMAWHLSEEARESQHRFKLPKKLHEELFPFQRAAVLVAAGHLEKRGGVLLGDVVGLGKTFMATALARLMEDRHDLQTLIVCPPNLVPMYCSQAGSVVPSQFVSNRRPLTNALSVTAAENSPSVAAMLATRNSEKFTSGSMAVKQAWDLAVAAINSADFATALSTLKEMRSRPDLIPGQAAAIDEITKAINTAIAHQ